ncbi:hypothetical protein MKX08_001286 [Trichoderma sp. CBMAI-0020]|nr:hypothetical protein MKX08_001286 [Trichoderma sp. CBMAI-0020]
MFATHMDTFSRTQESESFGYITDELLRQVETPKRLNRMAAMQQDQEIAFPELEENLSRLVTKDEIKYAINTLGLFQSKTAAERDRIIQDTNGAWSEIITDAVCATLGTIVLGTDLDEELNSLQIPTTMRRSPITESERGSLQALLRSRVKANEQISSNNTIDLEKLSKKRAYLGENLPPDQDLASICSLRNIDVDTLSVNQYNSPIKARAPHIIAMVPVIQKVLEMVSVQRGLLTPKSLSTGDTTLFGMGVAGLTIRTIELTSKDSDSSRERLHSHISELLKCSEDLDVQTGKVEAMLDRVIMELPTNHSVLVETIGRLWGINQTHHVEWEILIAKHTFDAFIEGSIMKEYSAVAAVTANLVSAISGEARMICAYEIVRQQFGQEYSLYSRMRAPWNEMDGDDMRREGYFYSALAKFFFRNPDQAFLVGRYNIRKIALAWKVGMEIIVDMVKEPVPLEAGEGLVLQYL